MEYFTTQHLELLFGVTHTTIKKRAREFAAYLSPTATPPDGGVRRYTQDDVRVLALVDDYHRRGFKWEDAHVALKRGERGEIPIETDLITATQTTEMEIMELKVQMNKLSDQYKMTLGQNQLLREQLAEKERQIQELYERLAELKVQIKH